MNSAWSIELTRLLAVISSAILFGITTDFPYVSLVIHFVLYLVWIFIQVKELEEWISRGTKRKDAPDNTGIWQRMVQNLYRAQRTHTSRKKQLASMANYYHAVMRALPNATVVINSDREIEWANKASQKLLGINPAKDVGQRIDNIIRIPELDKLFNFVSPDQRILVDSPNNPSLVLSIRLLEYQEGSNLLIAQDISHRVATQKLRKAFIANASHELRTPLTVILGYLEMLDDDEELPQTVSKVVEHSYDQAKRMDGILDNLLLLSKLEGRTNDKSSGELIDVKDMLHLIVSDFKVSSSKTKHEFIIDACEHKLKIIETDLYSVCQNLISNAIKYSPEKSKVTITWQVDEAGFGCLSVTDEGPGIPQEHINRLTERFYRVNNSTAQIRGTGLGLSIVKHILDNFDGYLEIQSTINQGSTFKACFPAYRLVNSQE